ncbi:Rnase Y domain-containing protein, partial [Lentibacillus sp.]|uniref:Rnase Y domain-containing protein n=1 Tax=Lentibacillus sp. TaxID=1925746 RepID=UPI002B4B5156
MDNPLIISILLAVILIVGIVVGYLIRKTIAEAKISSAENLAKQIVDEAHRNADAAKKEALL